MELQGDAVGARVLRSRMTPPLNEAEDGDKPVETQSQAGKKRRRHICIDST